MSSQRVLITAGAAGIGREIARAFAATGAKIFVCDIDAAALNALADEIDDLKTGICDVSKRHDIERMVVACTEALGGLDVLVNNAGIAGPTAPVEKTDPDEWEKVMQVDLIGTFNVTRCAIPYLKKSQAGVIINMSLGCWSVRLCEPKSLLHCEVGNHRIHQDTFNRVGRVRHSRQCNSTGCSRRPAPSKSS